MTSTHKKSLAILVAAVVVTGGASFYGGMQYARSMAQGGNRQFQFTGMPLSGQASQGGAVQRTGQRAGGATAGEIIGKDDKSITVKLQNGGSQIVFLSDSTKISKSVDGVPADLSNGIQVVVMGSANSDGSLTAQTVQVRPVGQGPPGGASSSTQGNN